MRRPDSLRLGRHSRPADEKVLKSAAKQRSKELLASILLTCVNAALLSNTYHDAFQAFSAPRQVGRLGEALSHNHDCAGFCNPRYQRPRRREHDDLARLALATRAMMQPPRHHDIMAQRYSDWARQQVDRAQRTLNPKARNDRLALAEYYLQLAEGELAASRSIVGQEPASVDNLIF